MDSAAEYMMFSIMNLGNMSKRQETSVDISISRITVVSMLRETNIRAIEILVRHMTAWKEALLSPFFRRESLNTSLLDEESFLLFSKSSVFA
jgi:hypothetical protein